MIGSKSIKVLSAFTLAILSLGLSLTLAADFRQLRLTPIADSDRDAFAPSLNADGVKVVFSSDADFLSQGIANDQFEIWLYDTTTLTYTRLTTASAINRGSFDPYLSLDGAKVAFRSDSDFFNQGNIQDNQFEIWLYDLEAMKLTRVTTAAGSGLRQSFSPVLSGDSRKIAFYSDADFLSEGIQSAKYEIWLYDIETMAPSRVTTATGSGFRQSSNPSLNFDGSQVIFESDADLLSQNIPDNQTEIWLYDTTTLTYTRLTTASQNTRISRRATTSADGMLITFESDSDFLNHGIEQGQIEVWLYNLSAKTLRRISTSSAGALRASRNPAISSDGRIIAFESDSAISGQAVPDNQFEIWLYDTSASTFSRVTTASDANRDSLIPSLDGDGRQVAFQSNSDFSGQAIPEEQTEIWLFSRSGGAIFLPLVLKN